MNNENRILVENFLSEIKIIVESNYMLDNDGKILLKVSKKQLKEQCKEMIKEYAKEIKEEDDDLRKHLLSVIDNQLKEEDDDAKKFYDERKLVKEILSENEKKSRKSSKENDEFER